MLIYPALDIADGMCVRLRQGDFTHRTVYSADPVDTVLRFRDAGLTRIHVVDLDGARVGSIVNLKTLAQLAAIDGVEIQAGGGIRSRTDADLLRKTGIRKIVLGSVAVSNPGLVRELALDYGPETVVVAVDVRNGSV
ncbi:MAG: HisA/HisF-related TIM barrel protein, partial [Bacteroidota bacterium]